MMMNKNNSLECGIESIPVVSKLFDLADGKTFIEEWDNTLDPNKFNLILEVYPLQFLKLGTFNSEKSLNECIDDVIGSYKVFGSKIPDSFYQKDLYLIL